MCAAALGEGRYAAHFRSKGSVLAQALQKPVSELTRADAMSFACSRAWVPPSFVKGMTAPLAAAGFANTAEYFALNMTEDWLCK